MLPETDEPKPNITSIIHPYLLLQVSVFNQNITHWFWRMIFQKLMPCKSEVLQITRTEDVHKAPFMIL